MAKKKNTLRKKPIKGPLGDTIENIENPEWLYPIIDSTQEISFSSEETVTLLPQEIYFPGITTNDDLTLDTAESGIPNILTYVGDDQGIANQIVNFSDTGTQVGVGYKNNQTILPSGASAWLFDGMSAHDAIHIPSSADVDNLHSLTLEFLIYLKGPSGGNEGKLFYKRQHTTNEDNAFEFYVDDINMCLVLKRGTVLLGEVDVWKTKDNSLSYGNWYYIQLVWAAGTTAGTTPIIYQNNKSKELTHTSIGTHQWANDANFPVFIGNSADGGNTINATLAVFRVYHDINTPNVCTSNFLSDSWRMNNPDSSQITVMGSPPPDDPDPLLRIGKNLKSLSVKIDYSEMITKLYPRGSGSAPSELTLATPQYWPAMQKLQLTGTDSSWAYFTLPGEFSCYAGATTVGAAVPSGMLIGHGSRKTGTYAISTAYFDRADLIVNGGFAVAQTFHLSATTRIWSIQLYLMRTHYPNGDWNAEQRHIEWTDSGWPRVTVGVYTVQSAKDLGEVPIYEPFQGPLVWASTDLKNIPLDKYGWITFPVHGAPLSAGNYSVVLSLYPTALWPYDIVGWRTNSNCPAGSWGTGAAGYALQSSKGGGITPGAWLVPNYTGLNRDLYRFNMGMTFVQNDVTSKFKQSDGLHPGRMVKCAIADYNPGIDYIIHYKHAPYMMNWAAKDRYGLIEGTYKEDSYTTADALVNGATEYLKSVSAPTLTWEVDAIDLYEMNPTVNWAEELTIGTPVTVQDQILGLDQKCTVSKISKPNLNNPHDIVLTLDNADKNTSMLLSKLAKTQVNAPKYLQGQTVQAPFVSSQLADANNPAKVTFQINENALIVPSVKLTVLPQPYQVSTADGLTNTAVTGQIAIYVDGTQVAKM